MDPLRFVKAEIRQLLLQRGALSIAQLPEEYLKCYRKPLTQALKKLDSQYTPESARSGNRAVALESPRSARSSANISPTSWRCVSVPTDSTRLSPPASEVLQRSATRQTEKPRAARRLLCYNFNSSSRCARGGCSSSSSCCSCSGDRTLRSMQLKRSSRSSSNSISGGVNSISCASRCTR